MEVALSTNSWLHLTDLLEFKGNVFWGQTEYPDVPFSTDDEYYQLTSVDAKRIDLVAYDKYGDPELMWVLLLANDKILPNSFYAGETIRIPALSTIEQVLKQKT
jgi:hypothetical protein